MPHGAGAGTQPSVPASFAAKKSQILAHLDQPEDEYADNSPKGTVDAQIRDLIDEINAYDGFVTTSSCAGRVAVFVEGPRGVVGRGGGDERKREGEGQAEEDSSVETGGKGRSGIEVPSTSTSTLTSPGGKGGGRWLYVSHDPVPMSMHMLTDTTGDVKTTASNATKSAHGPEQGQGQGREQEQEYFSTLFHLCDPSSSPSQFPSPSPIPCHPPASSSPPPEPPRLIHLSFSPLILHVHCATLRHARPLLAAAVNAGFRESGVQSLRALDDGGHGVMVAVRTAGLAFETVVGVVARAPLPRDSGAAASPASGGDHEVVGLEESQSPSKGPSEVVLRLVGEDYLAMCAGVVNERFAWNVERRERFRRELRSAMERDGLRPATAAAGDETRAGWEDKDERRRRKRDLGLERQRIMNQGAARNPARRGGQEQQLEELDQDLTALGL